MNLLKHILVEKLEIVECLFFSQIEQNGYIDKSLSLERLSLLRTLNRINKGLDYLIRAKYIKSFLL
jgi:hypothetical protein